MFQARINDNEVWRSHVGWKLTRKLAEFSQLKRGGSGERGKGQV